MSIALDIGNSHMRSLRRRRYRLIGRSCRSACTTICDTDSRRQVLDRLGVSYLAADGLLVVPGNAADVVADLFRIPAAPLLSPSMIKRKDSTPFRGSIARQALAELIETLLPESRKPGEFCCFTTGGLADEFDGGWSDDQDFLSQVICHRGYQPLAIGSAAAVVLAELGRKALTGVGITLGAARCEAALVRHGVELARFVVGRGGDSIDEQLARRQSLYLWDHAGNRRLDLRSARAWKESKAASLLAPASPQEEQLAELYRSLIADVVTVVHQAFDAAPDAFDGLEPVAVICAGGTASHPGFRELVLDELRKRPLPVGVARVQVPRAWQYTVARGCLIRAALEEETLFRRAA